MSPTAVDATIDRAHRTGGGLGLAPPTPVTVAGWGSALPELRITNAMLATTLDTDDAWIVARTGIRERRLAADHETTLPLATRAARAALDRAGVSASTVDLIVVATCTAERPMPSTASEVAAALGCTGGAFDLDAACAGFVHALVVASGVLTSRVVRRALVIGADTMSRVVDPTDRSTAVLFGDGAAALLLEARGTEPSSPTGTDRATPGLLAADLVSDGDGAELLHIDAPGARAPATSFTRSGDSPYLAMDGRAVFHRVVRGVAASMTRTLERAGCTPDDIAWFVPHQANARIVDAIAARVGIDTRRVAANGERYGNTSAASIPLLLAESAEVGSFADGDLVLASGFGAGLSIATALWRWECP